MVNLTFGDVVYNDIPESYSEMTFGTFQKLITFQESMKGKDINIHYSISLIALIIGCPEEYIFALDGDDVETILDIFDYAKVMPVVKTPPFIEIDGVKYIAKKNNKLNFGEMISIEHLNIQVENNTDNFHIILAILIRPATEVAGNLIISPLEDDYDSIVERGKLFQHKVFVEDIYGILVNFTNGAVTNSIENSGHSLRLKVQRTNQSS